jgi:hypothetical protein
MGRILGAFTVLAITGCGFQPAVSGDAGASPGSSSPAGSELSRACYWLDEAEIATFVDGVRLLREEFALSRSEMLAEMNDLCVRENLPDFQRDCSGCSLAVVEEVFSGPAPILSPRELAYARCRGAGFTDNTIDSFFSLATIARNDGLLGPTDFIATCRTTDADVNTSECITCLSAIAEVVWGN